ncbi:hypothetical protein NQZ68_024337 [Dissostichus eleginoides]|nr:hypothetical protein NQZ68_024337 [Dissostichus eleginoides]
MPSEEEEDEEEEDEEEDTGILPQKEPACQQHPQKVWVELDKDTLEALKEMPRLVATMKAALDKMSGSSSSGSCSSSGDSQQTGRNTGSNDLMFLGNSSVQELATLIFGNETLAKSTLTGKGKSAETLDPEKEDIDAGRECLIKGLCIYLNEDPEDLLKEYMVKLVRISRTDILILSGGSWLNFPGSVQSAEVVLVLSRSHVALTGT